MNCEAKSSFDSTGSTLFFKALTLPYNAFVITRPPISCCLFCFLFATFCNNCLAFSAAARASWTCRNRVYKFNHSFTQAQRKEKQYIHIVLIKGSQNIIKQSWACNIMKICKHKDPTQNQEHHFSISPPTFLAIHKNYMPTVKKFPTNHDYSHQKNKNVIYRKSNTCRYLGPEII